MTNTSQYLMVVISHNLYQIQHSTTSWLYLCISTAIKREHSHLLHSQAKVLAGSLLFVFANMTVCSLFSVLVCLTLGTRQAKPTLTTKFPARDRRNFPIYHVGLLA